MNRFAILAITFAVLTLGLGYEGVRASIHAVDALFGVGMPRLVLPGLINLGLAVLIFSLASMTLRLARTQWTLRRLTQHRHDDRTA